MSTKRSYLSKDVVEMPDSGIKDFFDIANTMDGALSLGVGEPDFQTPEHVREAAVASIRRAETKYTDNRGTVELRAAAAEYLEKFDLHYDRSDEILITMGASEGIDLALRALVDPGDEVLGGTMRRNSGVNSAAGEEPVPSDGGGTGGEDHRADKSASHLFPE